MIFSARSKTVRPAAPRGVSALPERVRAALRDQETKSEVLIGWIQLGVVATFGALYAIAPKTFDPNSAVLQPVPIALGSYLLFTLLRLVLAYRRALAPWFLMLSVAVDIGLLMTLIWSFHIQYAQPPSFYLKAPTLLYVFIFIALRALRFDPAFVLTTGATAVAGWVLLVGYAVTDGPMQGMVTRSYVEYLTGNRILLGAEFDKIITIAVVTGILAAALCRGRRLLVQAVAEAAAARELSRFFAPEVARIIADADTPLLPGQCVARDAAILMVDLRGFTRATAGLPPDAVIRLLADYQSRLVPVIGRFGGSVDKFMGDGILASFGVVRPSPTYAADAVRAADALAEAGAAWTAERAVRNEPALAVNAAVAIGPIVAGAVGDGQRLEYTVIGDAVNLAAKLEKHNKAVGAAALATAAAYAAAVEQGLRRAPPERIAGARVEGVEEPVDLVILAPTAGR